MPTSGVEVTSPHKPPRISAPGQRLGRSWYFTEVRHRGTRLPPAINKPGGRGEGSGAEEEPVVELVHLLKEDEGEHGVGAQAGIVWCEALP